MIYFTKGELTYVKNTPESHGGQVVELEDANSILTLLKGKSRSFAWHNLRLGGRRMCELFPAPPDGHIIIIAFSPSECLLLTEAIFSGKQDMYAWESCLCLAGTVVFASNRLGYFELLLENTGDFKAGEVYKAKRFSNFADFKPFSAQQASP